MPDPASQTSSSSPDPQRLRIRKYPNRRYYDSTRSRHLTLADLYAAVRDGYEIEVTDSKSGEDITAKVLAQMIIELDPPKLGVFPVPLLHRLLRANQQLMSDFTQKYFNQALEAFLDSQKKFEQSLRNALGLNAATPTVADWAKMMWAPTAWTNATTGGGGGSSGGAQPAQNDAAGTSPPSSPDELAKLRAQVGDLQEQLAKGRARKPKRTGSTTRKRNAPRASNR